MPVSTRRPLDGADGRALLIEPTIAPLFCWCKVEVQTQGLEPNGNGTFPRDEARERLALAHALKLISLTPEFHTTVGCRPLLSL